MLDLLKDTQNLPFTLVQCCPLSGKCYARQWWPGITNQTCDQYSIREQVMQDRRIMLKIICFSGDHQFFQISPGIRSLYERGKEPINLLAGDA